MELLDHPGAGRARNAGIALARRTFIALVDDDDTITPDYLSALYAHAEWDVVPMAWLDDVATDGTVNESTPINQVLAFYAGQTVGAEQVVGPMACNGCKLHPTALVRQVSHNTGLRSGVDVEFLTRLYAAGRFRMHILRRDEGAIYQRTVRARSISGRTTPSSSPSKDAWTSSNPSQPRPVPAHRRPRCRPRRDRRPNQLHPPLPQDHTR